MVTAMKDQCIEFELLESMLNDYFYQPDCQAIRTVLGAVKAHDLAVGDPAWMFVVAPPSTGKTATSITASAGLPGIVLFGDITENTFLSGMFGAQQPGLLEKLGAPREDDGKEITEGNGILLAKDFTTVLSMRREKRATILSQLREIYDGEFVRAFGTGVTKIWRGRVTMVAAVTPALDQHYSIFSTLGERFLQVRWHRPDSELAGEIAIAQHGQEQEMRENMQAMTKMLFDESLKVTPTLSPDSVRRVACMAEITALSRTHVSRAGSGNREIEYVPEPEGNTRLAKAMAALAKGIAALNRHDEVGEEELQDVLRVGFDSIPPARRTLILAAANGQAFDSIQMARTVRDRQAEELQQLGVLDPYVPEVLSERVSRLISVASPVEVQK